VNNLDVIDTQASVTQLVEYRTFNPLVAGSSPARSTTGILMYNHKAKRESFQLVEQTCPHVDAALASVEQEIKEQLDVSLQMAEKSIKEQTQNLRDALIEALDRALTAEDQVSELENRVAELESQLENHA